MISPEDLRKGPQTAKTLPILSDEQVRDILVEKVEAAKAVTGEIRGLDEYPTVSFQLFYMNADEELSNVSSRERNRIGLLEKGRFQEIAFEVMSRYGLNPNISKPEFTSCGWNPDGTVEHDDGTSSEILIYPSQIIPGLSFNRERDFYTDTKKTIEVRWGVEAQRRPFREHFRRLFPKAPIQHPAV